MGMVFNLQKFCVNDGPGIRTTVFLKGCPLRCAWCHNPESQRTMQEISFHADKCLYCGRCVELCPNACHNVSPEGHVYDRTHCAVCGTCIGWHCPALERIGEEKTPEEVLEEVMKDKVFYDASGGGMTLSGGEPMSQFAFTKALLEGAKARGLHTCMETCGWASREQYEEIRPLVDIFLWDYKESDPEKHKEFTGVSNEKILSNLAYLDAAGSKIVLRCPIIPGFNARPEHLEAIAARANSMKNVLEINIEPYHPLGSSKCKDLGRDYALDGVGFPEKETVEEWIAAVAARTSVKVCKA